MDKENLAKSITLIGPSCVGKSLISRQLAEKLNIPLISVDDLFDFIELEMGGFIDGTEQKQQAYIDFCMNDVQNFDELKLTLNTPQDIEEEKRIITKFVDKYRYYKNLIGDLSPLYKVVSQYDNSALSFKNEIECICALNYTTNEILSYIFTKLNQPIIIDPPASYGWQAHNKINFLSQIWLMRLPLQMEIMFVKNDMEYILNNTQTVLLLPSNDYNNHNAFEQVKANNTILQDLDNYYTPKVEITTSGLFYTSRSAEEKYYLKQRTRFNIKEAKVKEDLKNSSEVNNLRDEILSRLKELQQAQTLTNN